MPGGEGGGGNSGDGGGNSGEGGGAGGAGGGGVGDAQIIHPFVTILPSALQRSGPLVTTSLGPLLSLVPQYFIWLTVR